MDVGSLLARVNRELDITRLPILILHEHALECNSLANTRESEDDRTNLYQKALAPT
jgi:hypothetical protein